MATTHLLIPNFFMLPSLSPITSCFPLHEVLLRLYVTNTYSELLVDYIIFLFINFLKRCNEGSRVDSVSAHALYCLAPFRERDRETEEREGWSQRKSE